jgi:hypothetical protein
VAACRVHDVRRSMRRSSTLERLSIESMPIGSTEAMLTVVARRDEAGGPFASVMAALQRPRAAEHEELWAHFFVDEVFVDVGRVLRIDQGRAYDSLFVARFRLPDIHLDGEPHTARVSFVTAVSHIAPQGTGEAVKAAMMTAPVAEAKSELVATLAALPSRRLRLVR